MSEAKAIKRLSRSPHWVWVAIDPVTKLLVALDVGDRTLAMAQRVIHHVAQVLAPDCAPLFVTDGFREYATALLTHYGQWVQPERWQAEGVSHVLDLSEGSSKLIPIHEKPNHQIVHLFRLGKANRTTH